MNSEEHNKDEEGIEEDQHDISIEDQPITGIEGIPIDLPQDVGFLRGHISQEALRALWKSEEFKNEFLNTEFCDMFVISIDIRRSTELMLKAHTPKQFSFFITTLCNRIIDIVLDNYGMVDKFTGDGILAFFPDFYSGEDAGYYALHVAALCHKTFRDTYKAHRSSFISVLNDVGLGIGIDFGVAHLIQMLGGLTVVGVPVVYACRMSGVNTGITLLNQHAYEKVSEKFSEYFFISESEIKIKHEGNTLGYTVIPSGKTYVSLKKPSWAANQQMT